MVRSETRDWAEDESIFPKRQAETDRSRSLTDDIAWGHPQKSDAEDHLGAMPSERPSWGESNSANKQDTHADQNDYPGNQAAELTDKDRKAIADYTGIGYQRLNTTLRTGSIEQVEQVASGASDLSDAIRKLPEFQETVQRGGEVPESLIDRYQVGGVVVENGYTSATTDPEQEFGGNALWIIESQHGRALGELSNMKAEQEVLFDHFSTFRVLSKERDAELKRWIIYMEEL